jgi:uncharacterized protein YndB with AHSA1/START domain
MKTRIDTASKVIRAPAQKVYDAFLDPGAIATWRPPAGMKCTIYEFEPAQGGKYRMAFEYKTGEHEVTGKTSEHADVFTGRFIELMPGQRITEAVDFESDDPAFAGTMIITTDLEPAEGGTKVTFTAINVPVGIKPDDHYKGMTSSLEQLAAFVE